MNGLDLFSGIGGISYGLEGIVRPILYCEIDPFCQSVLLSRMQTRDLPKAPIWDDVRTLDFYPSVLPFDIITAGFPCQDISVAGHGKGLEGERSGLFFEILRISKQVKPKFIFLENVPAITSRGGLQVVKEIASMGYDCRWCVISAASVGALHKRERWFLLAHSLYHGTPPSKERKSVREISTSRKLNEQKKDIRQIERTSLLSNDVALNDSNTNSITSGKADPRSKSEYLERKARGDYTGFYGAYSSREHWQEIVSTMGKCTDGLPHQVDRLKSLGNAVVPQQVRRAWEILTRGK